MLFYNSLFGNWIWHEAWNQTYAWRSYIYTLVTFVLDTLFVVRVEGKRNAYKTCNGFQFARFITKSRNVPVSKSHNVLQRKKEYWKSAIVCTSCNYLMGFGYLPPPPPPPIFNSNVECNIFLFRVGLLNQALAGCLLPVWPRQSLPFS